MRERSGTEQVHGADDDALCVVLLRSWDLMEDTLESTAAQL